MINFKITILLILLIIAPDLFAVKLTDKLSQGSIVSGYVNPNIKLKLMDRDIKVHKSGLFVFGVARDAPTELTLTTIDKKKSKKFVFISSYTKKIQGTKNLWCSSEHSKAASLAKRENKK